MRSARGKGFRCLRTATRALPLDILPYGQFTPFFYENKAENGFAILSGVTVVTVTLGRKNLLIPVRRYNKVTARSITRAAVITNRYATVLRGARRAQNLI